MKKKELSIKIFYFILFAQVGVFTPYISIFYASRGLTGSEMGLLMMVSTLIASLLQFVWGYIADRTGKAGIILTLCTGINGILILLFPLIHSFHSALFIVIFYSLFFKAIIPLTDSSALSIFEARDKTKYGNLRVFGSIGFLFSTLFLSRIIDRFGLSFMFLLFSLLSFIGIIFPSKFHVERDITPRNFAFFHDLKILMKNRKIRILFITAFLVEFAISILYGFLGLYFDNIGLSSSQIGIFWTIGILVEIPVMFFSGKIVKKFGTNMVIIISIMSAFLRYFIMANTHSWIIVAFLQLLHGIFFGLFYPAVFNVLDRNSPESVKSSSMMIYSILTFNLGNILGYLSNGFILQFFGIFRLFLINSLFFSFGLVVFFVGMNKYKKFSLSLL